jgi:CheY-like chemotaxis protein
MIEVAERLVGLRVLVVEDEAMVAMLIEDFLTDLGCVVVGVAGTLASGLKLARDTSIAIDGAMLDINLGGEKVFPIADVLADRGIPFVFATGYGPEGLAPRFAGHSVITKPFKLEPLRALVTSAWT